MMANIKYYLGGPDRHYPGPALEVGEEIILQDQIALRGFWGTPRLGRLTVTNRRLFWDDNYLALWPLKRRKSFQWDISQIERVDNGTLYDFVAGGRPMRIRLRSGRNVCFMDDADALKQWMAAIRDVMANRLIRG